jgi:hypothetical protein
VAPLVVVDGRTLHSVAMGDDCWVVPNHVAMEIPSDELLDAVNST